MAHTIFLSKPVTEGGVSLERAIQRRRSIRAYKPERLDDLDRGQLLWAAQGLTDPRGYRAAPSAGGLYPLEIYWIEQSGLYHYQPVDHALDLHQAGDLRFALCKAALNQEMLLQAPATMLFAAVFSRTQAKYGKERGYRYVLIDLGHAAQNVLLQATALGLGAVPIGAFNDQSIQAALKIPVAHAPLYLIPIGHPV